MAQIGRNDPCPCGSGRKYKKCCLNRVQAQRAVEYTDADRERGFALAERHIARPHWQGVFREKIAEVMEGREAVLDMPSLDDYSVAQMTHAVVDWIFFDDVHTPRGPLEDLLAARSVVGGPRRFLRAMGAANLRPYEVVDTWPGQRIALRDLADDVELTVQERSASKSLTPGDMFFARVVARASERLEIERGLLAVSPIAQAEIEAACRDYRTQRASQAQRSADLGLALLDVWIEWTLRSWMPEMTVGGESMMFTTTTFDMVTPEAVPPALDALDELTCTEPDHWRWEAEQAPGFLRLDGDRLILETLSVEQGEAGRALLESALGATIRHRSTTHEHPAQAVARRAGDTPLRPADDIPDDIRRQVVQAHLNAHYEAWLDDGIPALDGASPRDAARTPALVPKLEGLLRGLDRQYLTALKDDDEVPYDPSWMWTELGLMRRGQTDPDQLGALGHEVVAQHLDGISALAETIAARRRREPGFDATTVFDDDDILSDLGARKLLRDQGQRYLDEGGQPGHVAHWAALVGTQLGIAINHTLHGAQTFHVAEGLAYQLAHTALDLRGADLQLPFASQVIAFRDRHTLGLMERALAADISDQRGVLLATLSAYIQRLDADDSGGHALRVSLVSDARDGRLPYLWTDDLQLDAADRLDAVLDGLFVDEAPLRDVLRIVLNAVLYATAIRGEWQPRARPATAAADAGDTPPVAQLEVMYLPGDLDIGTLRDHQRLDRSPDGQALNDGFMMPGRWRRANPDWKDQRPRWRAPQWNGPDIAMLVERQREREAD